MPPLRPHLPNGSLHGSYTVLTALLQGSHKASTVVTPDQKSVTAKRMAVTSKFLHDFHTVITMFLQILANVLTIFSQGSSKVLTSAYKILARF